MTWVRLVHLRRAGEPFGREILVGAAATVPLGTWLFIATFLPGTAIGTEWQHMRTLGLGDLGIRFFMNLDLLQQSFFVSAAALFLAALLSKPLQRASLSLFAGILLPAFLLLGTGGGILLSLTSVTLFALLGTVAIYKGGLISLVTFGGTCGLCLSSVVHSTDSWAFFRGLTGPAVAAGLVAAGVWHAWSAARPPSSGGEPRPTSDTTAQTVVTTARG